MSETDTETPPVRDNRKKGIDLDAMSVPDLMTLRDAVIGKLREKVESEKNAIIEDAKRRLAEIGVGAAGLFGSLPSMSRKGRSDAGGSLPVKFRGPNGETWSGRGRIPRWLAAVEAEGGSRDKFAV